MLPASNAGAGMNICTPDVVVVPPGVPTALVNLGPHAMAAPFWPNVLISFVPAVNQMSMVTMTQGDQVGAPCMGPGEVVVGNPVVMLNGAPAVNLTCPAMGNSGVAATGAVLVPSVTTVFFSCAGGPSPGAIDAAGMAQLSAALAEPAPVETLSPEGIAFVAVPVFSSGVPARVYSAVTRWGADRVAAMIIDLRGCPGGELTAALELAGDFLPEGSVLVTATDADGDETVYRARQEKPYTFPVVVLVDGGTASAAEIFAGCLQAHRRAVVVGARTYGKGTAQALLPADTEPGALYATVASFTLANGEPLEGRGIHPDVEAAPSDPPGGCA